MPRARPSPSTPTGPLAEANWAKQRLGRATQALPNGFCGLPVQKTCPHANACLTCPMFVTTPEFLPQHREHRQQVLQIISAAEARGQHPPGRDEPTSPRQPRQHHHRAEADPGSEQRMRPHAR